MPEYRIRTATADDHAELIELYRAVAAVEGGLARTAAEISSDYVAGFLGRALTSGLSLVAERPDGAGLAAEIHAYRPGPQVFAHIFGELTIAVHPHCQGQGLGRRLFQTWLAQVDAGHPDIRRVELIARESNQRAIALYKTLGFRPEGRLVGRIRSLNGGYEADIPMAWLRSKTT